MSSSAAGPSATQKPSYTDDEIHQFKALLHGGKSPHNSPSTTTKWPTGRSPNGVGRAHSKKTTTGPSTSSPPHPSSSQHPFRYGQRTISYVTPEIMDKLKRNAGGSNSQQQQQQLSATSGDSAQNMDHDAIPERGLDLVVLPSAADDSQINNNNTTNRKHSHNSLNNNNNKTTTSNHKQHRGHLMIDGKVAKLRKWNGTARKDLEMGFKLLKSDKRSSRRHGTASAAASVSTGATASLLHSKRPTTASTTLRKRQRSLSNSSSKHHNNQNASNNKFHSAASPSDNTTTAAEHTTTTKHTTAQSQSFPKIPSSHPSSPSTTTAHVRSERRSIPSTARKTTPTTTHRKSISTTRTSTSPLSQMCRPSTAASLPQRKPSPNTRRIRSNPTSKRQLYDDRPQKSRSSQSPQKKLFNRGYFENGATGKNSLKQNAAAADLIHNYSTSPLEAFDNISLDKMEEEDAQSIQLSTDSSWQQYNMPTQRNKRRLDVGTNSERHPNQDGKRNIGRIDTSRRRDYERMEKNSTRGEMKHSNNREQDSSRKHHRRQHSHHHSVPQQDTGLNHPTSPVHTYRSSTKSQTSSSADRIVNRISVNLTIKESEHSQQSKSYSQPSSPISSLPPSCPSRRRHSSVSSVSRISRGNSSIANSPLHASHTRQRSKSGPSSTMPSPHHKRKSRQSALHTNKLRKLHQHKMEDPSQRIQVRVRGGPRDLRLPSPAYSPR